MTRPPRTETDRACPCGTLLAGPFGQVEDIRRELDTMFDGIRLGDATLEHWEALPAEYGRRNQTIAPARLLDMIAADLLDLRLLLQRNMPIKQRAAPTRITGQLSATAALCLLDLGDFRRALGWYHTGGLAAEEVRAGQLAGDLLVRSAVASFYDNATDHAVANRPPPPDPRDGADRGA